MKKTIDEYLDLPYTVSLVHDRDEESGFEGFAAEVEELPGCWSQADTIEGAAARIREAMVDWLTIAIENDIEIPEPVDPDAYSGRFVLRLPRSLHAELARQAEREGVSLNQYVATTLAGSIGWRRSEERRALRA